MCTCVYLCAPVVSGNCTLDIILVIDTSASNDATKFQRIISFLTQVVSQPTINIGRTSTSDRISLLTFASTIRVAFDLQQRYSTADVVSGLQAITTSTTLTNTPEAVLQASYVRLTVFYSIIRSYEQLSIYSLGVIFCE